METVIVSINSKKFVNRGFMNGPFCPIYGIGASLIYLFLTPYKNNMTVVFMFGMIIATVVEYTVAAGMEKLFNAKWWDYSYKKFNIKGRVSLDISIAWGFLSVFMLRVLQPIILNLVDKIPLNTGTPIAYSIILYLIADTGFTIFHILKLNTKLKGIDKIGEELLAKFEGTKIYSAPEEIKERLYNLSNMDFLEELWQKIEEESIKNSDNYKEFFEKLQQARTDFKTMTENYKSNIFEKRILNAYPKIKSFKYEKALKKFKKIIEESKSAKKNKDHEKDSSISNDKDVEKI